MAAETGTRALRVSEGIRKELAALLASEVKDPRAAGAVVTRVEMTGDLRNVRVFVRILEATDDEIKRRDVVNALRRASGMLRREISRRLGLRYAPEFKFAYDEGTDHMTNVERVLAEIEADKRGR